MHMLKQELNYFGKSNGLFAEEKSMNEAMDYIRSVPTPLDKVDRKLTDAMQEMVHRDLTSTGQISCVLIFFFALVNTMAKAILTMPCLVLMGVNAGWLCGLDCRRKTKVHVVEQPPIEETCTEKLQAAASKIDRILRRDVSHTPYCPLMNFGTIEHTALGECTLKSQIASSYSSFIYDIEFQPAALELWPQAVPTVDPRSSYVLKYFSDCPGHSQDILVREYAMNGFLWREGIVPRAIWLSGPGTWSLDFSMKVGYQETKCEEDESTVRFIVMEKVGMTVNNFLQLFRGQDVRMYLKEIMYAATKTLNLLERMHSMDAIHGDIHGGNIAVNKEITNLDTLENSDLILIDLGQSAFICSDEQERKTSNRLAYRLLSIWELKGDGIKGFRDDVFRLFELVSNWISFGRLRAMLAFVSAADPASQGTAATRQSMAILKTDMDYFGDRSLPEYVDILQYGEISSCLNNAMNYIKSMGSPGERVDFQRLQQDVQCASELL